MSQHPRPWPRLRRGLEHDYTVLKVREDIYADPRTRPGAPARAHRHAGVVQRHRGDDAGRAGADPPVPLRRRRDRRWRSPGGWWTRARSRPPPRRGSWKRRRATAPGALVPLGAVHPNPALQGNRCHSFLALDCVKRHEGHQDAGRGHPRGAVPPRGRAAPHPGGPHHPLARGGGLLPGAAARRGPQVEEERAMARKLDVAQVRVELVQAVKQGTRLKRASWCHSSDRGPNKCRH